MRFVLDQHSELDFYIACSLKEQSMGRYVALLFHINLIPSQPVFGLAPECWVFSGKAAKINFIIIGLTNRSSNP